MRLDDFDPNSINVGDQRGSGFSIGGAGGKIGCGSIVIALIGALVFGVDPGQMLGTMQGAGTRPGRDPGRQDRHRKLQRRSVSRETCNALSSLNKTWQPMFAAGRTSPFTPPKLGFYSQAGQSGCGAAQSAMGPFYCPTDQGIYIDTDFYREMETKLGAAATSPAPMSSPTNTATMSRRSPECRTRSAARSRRTRVRPTACRSRWNCRPIAMPGSGPRATSDKIEPGDIEEGLTAAHAIGDDVLTGGRVAEASFTHGSAAQRMQWLRKGLETGDEDQCDTFAAFRS